MSSHEIHRIVASVESKTGWTFFLEDVLSVLQYAEQKAAQNGKGDDYIPILFENELRDLVMREVINCIGREKPCVRNVT